LFYISYFYHYMCSRMDILYTYSKWLVIFFSLNTKCNGDLDENVEFSLSYFNNDIYV